MEKVTIIGSGFAGLSTACFLAQKGYDVTVIEKNTTPGGRARSFEEKGYTFDMGPSWYWMPDVFERFFNHFGYSHTDFYTLQRLDPSYKVFWEDESNDNIPANYNDLKALFNRIESGAGERLDQFLKEAAHKYDKGINEFVHKPSLSITEFAKWDIVKGLFQLDMFQSIHKHVRAFFKNPKLTQLTEFPILFLGALPQNTPALYSLMNYADMKLGTWYPMGGMVKIVDAMYQIAQSLGVNFKFDEAVLNVEVYNSIAESVHTDKDKYDTDAVVMACDYHHADKHLLPAEYANYDEKYWDSRKMAPSSLLYYLGIDKTVPQLEHHNLFFDAPFEGHAHDLYKEPKWPENPLMYVCNPSKTDLTVAPDGCENLFVLIPIAPGLKDNQDLRDKYLDIALNRIEKKTGVNIKNNIAYKRSYAYTDFVNDYNAYKGNAYGLANTLMQTAFLKPAIKNKKIKNLFYTGQLTVPGPGVPPSIISGEVVATQVAKTLNKKIIAV